MLQRIPLTLLTAFIFTNLPAQQPADAPAEHRGFANFRQQNSKFGPAKFYIAYGYNKEWYSKSDLRFYDPSRSYDFTLHDMAAKDRPQLRDIMRVQLSIPQYGYRAGYYFRHSPFGLEINFDHAKYIVTDMQTVRMKGFVGEQVIDADTLVDFMHLEHTDGANFLMLNGLRRWQFFQGKYSRMLGVLKLGAGIVVPRSDVRLWEERNNHCFHVAGQIAGAEGGLRWEPCSFFFLEATAKGCFANYNKVLGVGDGLVSHRFWTGALLLHAGFQLRAGKKD